mmetsp:Transcript_76344/g.218722  ORF Transcript_76344/g.218722 Transcript_76344/m.218722 type:complete len:343 (+) Transcript_76344:417-1445(+)
MMKVERYHVWVDLTRDGVAHAECLGKCDRRYVEVNRAVGVACFPLAVGPNDARLRASLQKLARVEQAGHGTRADHGRRHQNVRVRLVVQEQRHLLTALPPDGAAGDVQHTPRPQVGLQKRRLAQRPDLSPPLDGLSREHAALREVMPQSFKPRASPERYSGLNLVRVQLERIPLPTRIHWHLAEQLIVSAAADIAGDRGTPRGPTDDFGQQAFPQQLLENAKVLEGHAAAAREAERGAAEGADSEFDEAPGLREQGGRVGAALGALELLNVVAKQIQRVNYGIAVVLNQVLGADEAARIQSLVQVAGEIRLAEAPLQHLQEPRSVARSAGFHKFLHCRGQDL